MTRVHLEQRGIDVQYNYSCCNFKDTVCRMIVKRTAWQYGGDGNAKYLSMHQINCGRFGFISSFQLEHKSSKIRYLYTCCELFNPRWRNQLQCYEAATPYVSENAQLVYSLAQIPVSCNGGFGFSSFQLQKKAAMQQWRFEFRCCRVEYWNCFFGKLFVFNGQLQCRFGMKEITCKMIALLGCRTMKIVVALIIQFIVKLELTSCL